MSIEDLRRKADAGNVVAQSILGLSYLYGIDVPVDLAEALRLLSMAVAAGAPRAAFGLAEMYRQGLGVPVNIQEALRLYENAATKGEFGAQIELARLHASGLGGRIDRDAAKKWYTTALEQEGAVEHCPEIEEAKAFLGAQ